MGMVLQQPAIAIQTVLSDTDSPIGLSILNFIMFLGGTVFVTVSQTLLEKQLNVKLSEVVPDIDIKTLTSAGATSLKTLVPADKIDLALNAYSDSMKAIWYLGLAMASAAFIASFGLEWKTVKKVKKETDEDSI